MSWVVLLLLSLPAWSAITQAPAVRPAVATVGSRRIDREDYERQVAVARQGVVTRAGEQPAQMQAVLRRRVLESLLRFNLLMLEAERTGVTVSPALAESALKRDAYFSPGGKFDSQRWQLSRTNEPARFQDALAMTSAQLGARRLEAKVMAQMRPADELVRAKALRQLERAITEDLSLRTADFSGSYPEPREREVVGYYAANAERFSRPARAALSIVFVNEPPRTPLELTDASAAAAWVNRMHHSADSILTAVAGGATLDDASAAFGGLHSGVSVLPDNFPGYWHGDAAVTASVFKAKPGSMLRAPVLATDGYLVVRVDQQVGPHVAPLAEVAKEIRGQLREDARLHHDEREQRDLFATLRDSLLVPAWTFRWAAVDTATVRVPEPSEADLDRWYRGHLADFSSFDAGSGAIVAKTLAQVRDAVRRGWMRDQRIETARLQAEELFHAWDAGRRSPSLEARLGVRLTALTPRGAKLDTGFAAAALSDTIWKRGEPRGSRLAPYARGYLLWQVASHLPAYAPTLKQVEPGLRLTLQNRQRAIDEAGARRLFDQDPARFGSGKRYFFTRMVVPIPPITEMKLTRLEVERWHQRNIAKYSSPEEVQAKHILISPANKSAAADQAAHQLADTLLAAIRAGARFDDIAARFSDDPATKHKGGDLGAFQRGAMLAAVEDAVFAMPAGELGGPVKSEVGYHILQVTEHTDAYVQPLKLVYTIVAGDLARARADTVVRIRADSLMRVLRTPAQARASALSLGYPTAHYSQAVDETQIITSLEPYFKLLFALKPGELMREKWLWKGGGYWITWLDSIAPPVLPNWSEARERALQAYRAGAGERALMAKVAELDSLSSAGLSLDSLGALWGGLKRSREISAVHKEDKAGNAASLDSLVFGSPGRAPALAVGQESGWVRWAGGVARVRLLQRLAPPADRLNVRMEELRRLAVERKLLGYFSDLRRRWPVRILDRELDDIPLPELPADD
jgi:hypothetical protein